MAMQQNHYERAMSLLEAAQGCKLPAASDTLTRQAEVCALLAIGATLVTISKRLESLQNATHSVVVEEK